MSGNTHELLIRAGRVYCAQNRFDAAAEVAVSNGRITAVGPHLAEIVADRELNFPDAVLLPGLVDLHAHPAITGSKYGIPPDTELLNRGVTTVLSQGDAGGNNWEEYRRTTLLPARTRIRMALNLSALGESMPGGCFEDLAWADVDQCVATIESSGDEIWGIAVNVSRIACGKTDPRAVMDRALQVATQTERPILYGMRDPRDWPLDDQLAQLRSGDVVTYCFRAEPNGIVQNGAIPGCLRAARERGVLFDVGHGMASFDFSVAETALAAGFPPDTISSDQYARHIGSKPPHDLLRTMSKLIAAGMPEPEAFAAVTSCPANILRLGGEIGQLTPGACADLSVIQFNANAAPLTDTQSVPRPGGCWEPLLTIRAGQQILPA
ncbi:dihydroorotase [Symmachiella dynata]|uniref:hypothetical protein n=1 Tax=Symmachiella dynata TaxID=2527995 RepID=UPI00118A132B|nr:hypothetical protein [Symmachiella dynata]QDT46556.1 dihydroorotase [Symmachiella dynata]